jgi:hypothetical protein
MAVIFCGVLLVGCGSNNNEEPETNVEKNIIYVNVFNEDSGDGSSWDNAFTSLQDALEIAVANDEIWIAEGTYYPSEDDATVSFVMKDDVSLYGGFDGDETSIEERNLEKNETILSGEIGDPNIIEDNSKEVIVYANNIIDGCTIIDEYEVQSEEGKDEKALEEGEAPANTNSAPPTKSSTSSTSVPTTQSSTSSSSSTTSSQAPPTTTSSDSTSETRPTPPTTEASDGTTTDTTTDTTTESTDELPPPPDGASGPPPDGASGPPPNSTETSTTTE